MAAAAAAAAGSRCPIRRRRRQLRRCWHNSCACTIAQLARLARLAQVARLRTALELVEVEGAVAVHVKLHEGASDSHAHRAGGGWLGAGLPLRLIEDEAGLELLLDGLARLVLEVGVELVDGDLAVAVVIKGLEELIRDLCSSSNSSSSSRGEVKISEEEEEEEEEDASEQHT